MSDEITDDERQLLRQLSIVNELFGGAPMCSDIEIVVTGRILKAMAMLDQAAQKRTLAYVSDWVRCEAEKAKDTP